MEAGYANVMALNGKSLALGAVEKMTDFGVRNLTLLLDGDPAGQKAAKKIAEASPIPCTIKTLPEDHDANSYLVKYGADQLHHFLSSVSGDALDVSRAESGASPSPDGTLVLGRRHYHIRGLEKGPRKLKATIRIEHGGGLHVDTLDLYSARSRRTLAQDLCRVFEEVPETIEADITKLLRHCEQLPEGALKDEGGKMKDEVGITPRQEKEARELGQRVDLIEVILVDFEIIGLKGEVSNKLLGYLAITSRKMTDPLSVLISSRAPEPERPRCRMRACRSVRPRTWSN